jgi:hypothetical protein
MEYHPVGWILIDRNGKIVSAWNDIKPGAPAFYDGAWPWGAPHQLVEVFAQFEKEGE